MLSREGQAAGVTEWSLWSGPAKRAERYASEELLNFWLTSPRMTVTEYGAELSRDREPEDYPAEVAGNDESNGGTTMTVTTDAPPLTVTQLNPSAALDATEAHIRRFAQCAGEHDYTILTLWAAHCHAIDAFDRSGRLHVTSELPGSGKTFILDLMATMTPDAEEIIDPTAAALFAMTDAGTILLI